MTTRKINPGRVYPETVTVIKATHRRLETRSQAVMMELAILLGCAIFDRAWEYAGKKLSAEDVEGIINYAKSMTAEDFAAIAGAVEKRVGTLA